MHGYRQLEITGVVPPPDVSESEAPLPFPELGHQIEEGDIRVVLVLRTLPEEAFRAAAYQCFLHGAHLRVVNPHTSPLPFRMVGQDAHGLYEIELAVPRLQRTQVVAKRALDLVLSGVLLTVLSPAFAVVAAAVKLSSPGPVFFEHERLGQGGRRFELLKFRTMVAEAEERLRDDPELYRKYVEHDYKLPPEEDPRITRIGRVLRTTSLDELPQLLNVLRGEMSLVGPRPIVPPEIEEYGVHAPVLLGEKPGVTGFWQIAGRSSVGYPQRARWEIAYVENWSLWLDLRILFWTVPVVLRKIGAH
jgi:lipopolysaccharide/colanic/teichoic acid biosynthesis glycosyltransferase